MTMAVWCWRALLARLSSRCQGLAVSAARWIRHVPWLTVSIGHCNLSPAAPPPPPLCLSEVGKPSWVGIWFLGTDTFHGWRRYKSLKRDPALGRHSINTDNTSPSLLLTLCFSSITPFFPFLHLLSPVFLLSRLFPNKNCKKKKKKKESPLSSSKECSFYHCVLSLHSLLFDNR